MRLRILGLALLLGSGLVSLGHAQETITNRYLKVSIDAATGTWHCARPDGARLFSYAVGAVDTANGALRTTDGRFQRSVTSEPFEDAIGAGKQLVLTLKDRQGEVNGELTLKVYDQFAGLRIDWQIQNSGKRGLNLRQVTVVDASADGKFEPPPAIRVLTSGMHSWEDSRVVSLRTGLAAQSHDFMAADAPRFVVGYLSANATYGTFEFSYASTPRQSAGAAGLTSATRPPFEFSYAPPRLQSSAEFNVLVDPGQIRRTDPLLVLFPENLFDGLESYASAVQKFNDLHPRQRASTAWCSWYAGYGAAKQKYFEGLEEAMSVNARVVKRLKPWGIDTLRVVDDSSEQRFGDWDFPYVPHGMGGLAARLRDIGTKPGVWLAPAFVAETSTVFKQHRDWLQHSSTGELLTELETYGNTMHFLDVSNPAAREHLRSIFQRVRDWGYEYVMIDFMDRFRVSDRYADPRLTRAEVYRLALKTIREALGPQIYLLGCGAPLLSSLGLVDAMRIGPDQWGKYGVENIGVRYFAHGKWWLNDPDALVGANCPLEQYRAWTTLAGISGSVVTIGDDLTALSDEKLQILKRIHPVAGFSGRPIDLFDAAPNNQWFLETSIGGGKSGLLTLFNWGSKDLLLHRIRPKEILRTSQKVLVYDFWNDYCLGESDSEQTYDVPPMNVRALCLVEATGAPQILGASNHLEQSGYALDKAEWLAAEKVLRGHTTGVIGEDYHLAVYIPPAYKPELATVNGKAVFLVKQQKNAWVIPVRGEGAPVEWSVKFR